MKKGHFPTLHQTDLKLGLRVHLGADSGEPNTASWASCLPISVEFGGHSGDAGGR